MIGELWHNFSRYKPALFFEYNRLLHLSGSSQSGSESRVQVDKIGVPKQHLAQGPQSARNGPDQLIRDVVQPKGTRRKSDTLQNWRPTSADAQLTASKQFIGKARSQACLPSPLSLHVALQPPHPKMLPSMFLTHWHSVSVMLALVPTGDLAAAAALPTQGCSCKHMEGQVGPALPASCLSHVHMTGGSPRTEPY